MFSCHPSLKGNPAAGGPIPPIDKILRQGIGVVVFSAYTVYTSITYSYSYNHTGTSTYPPGSYIL